MFGIFPKKLTTSNLQRTLVFWLSASLLLMLIYNIIAVANYEKLSAYNNCKATIASNNQNNSENIETICASKNNYLPKVIFVLVVYAILFFIIYPKFPKDVEILNTENKGNEPEDKTIPEDKYN